jgi:metal-responsive CopG/Arc/MetJ family transcriptional regulator
MYKALKGVINIMARIDIKPISEELIAKLDQQIAKLGLQSRSEYIRLIIELDAATGLLEALYEHRQIKKSLTKKEV